MKVFFIALPRLVTYSNFEILTVPTTSIYVLAAAVRKRNVEVRVIDPCEFKQYDNRRDLIDRIVEYLSNAIDLERPDLIGFSVNSFNWSATKLLIDSLKIDTRKSKILLGGLHATAFDEYVLEHTKADYVIRGEGEKTIVELCEYIQGKRDIDSVLGLTYKVYDKILKTADRPLMTSEDLSEQDIPAYELMPSNNQYKQIPIEASRGCQFGCAFCSIPHRWNWRPLDEKIVIERTQKIIESCKNKIQNAGVLFVDDCFTSVPNRAVNILKTLSEQYKNLTFFIEVRISNIIKHEFVEYLPDNCNVSMQLGVECGYDDGLKRIKKGIDLKQLHQGLSIIDSYGYSEKCFLSFIIGFPWETEKEINMTIDTIEYVVRRYGIMCNINWLFLLPSELWHEKNKYGIEIKESVFDDIGWMTDQKLFFAVHPLLDLGVVKRTEMRLNQLIQEKLRIRYNKPFVY